MPAKKSASNFAIQLRSVRNLTTGLMLLSDSEDPAIEASEFGIGEIVCDLPKTRVAPGHHVFLGGRLVMGDDEIPFEATGKIESCETGESARVRILLRQIDKSLWDRFHRGLRAKQDRVDKLLSVLKGEDS